MTILVVYSAIFGGTDILKPIKKWPGVECICYTDNEKIAAQGWRIIHIAAPSQVSSRLAAKRFKILPHSYFQNIEWSLWVDGTHVPRRNPLELLSQYGRQDFIAFRHPERDCIFDEGARCIDLGYPRDIIEEQLSRYREEGFPSNYGLIWGGALLRRHNNPQIKEAMDFWWAEILRGSIRDQLSLPYVIWRLNLRWAEIPGHVYWNNIFWYTPHGKRPSWWKDFIETKRASSNIFWKIIPRLKDRK